MKRALSFGWLIRRALLGLCLLPGLADSVDAHEPVKTVASRNHDYVSLEKWAKAHKLNCHWIKPERVIEVTGSTTRLVFEANSTQAAINGINVRLSLPFAIENEMPLVSTLDLDTAIAPLIFPPRWPAARPLKIICLDPGHGGKDSGNRVGSYFEKNYTLPLAFELRDQLQQAGFKVILTRTTDKYVPLPDRPALANREKADLFVSLHFNASPTDQAEVQGPETYCITPVGAGSSNAQGKGAGYGKTPANAVETESLILAYQVQKSLVHDLAAADRGVKRARFAVLRDATMPAILIEGGFMTHPVESKKIYDAAYRRHMAESIVQGILAYQKLTAAP